MVAKGCAIGAASVVHVRGGENTEETQVGCEREHVILHFYYPFLGIRAADIPASQIPSSKKSWALFLLHLSAVTAATTAKQALCWGHPVPIFQEDIPCFLLWHGRALADG